jgi:hypothetical protein
MNTGGRLIAGSHNRNEFVLINADENARVREPIFSFSRFLIWAASFFSVLMFTDFTFWVVVFFSFFLKLEQVDAFHFLVSFLTKGR